MGERTGQIGIVWQRSRSVGPRVRLAVGLIVCLAAGGSGPSAAMGRMAFEHVQWDFRTYYYAAAVYSQGGDPYRLEALSAAAGEPISLPYLYPPYVLHLFQPFLAVDHATAALIYFALKVVALVALLALWRRAFFPEAPQAALLLVAALAYNACIWRDLVAGNVSLFEQLAIWTGLLAYLQRKYRLFCLLIGISALFKGVSLLLLFLPLLQPERRRALLPVLGTVAAFLALHMASTMQTPELYREFLTRALAWDERGVTNPTALSFFRELATLAGRELGLALPSLAWALYGSWLVALAAIFLLVWRARGEVLGEREGLFFCLFVYALLLPRFKDYSFILLIVPSLAVLWETQASPRTRAGLWIALCLGATPLLFLTGELIAASGLDRAVPPGRTLQAAAEFLFAYQSLFAATALFALYAWRLARPAETMRAPWESRGSEAAVRTVSYR
jgi:hypothetical protein